MNFLHPFSPSLPSEKMDSLRVARPCSQKWDLMKGNDQKRYCEHCQLHVHNLSAMSPRQIHLLSQKSGRRCVAYFQTKDGGIRLRSRFAFLGKSFSRTRRLAASLLALLFPFSFISCNSKPGGPETMTSPEITQQPASPAPAPMPMGEAVLATPAPQTPPSPPAVPKPVSNTELMLLGDVAIPPPQPPATPPAPDQPVPHTSLPIPVPGEVQFTILTPCPALAEETADPDAQALKPSVEATPPPAPVPLRLPVERPMILGVMILRDH